MNSLELLLCGKIPETATSDFETVLSHISSSLSSVISEIRRLKSYDSNMISLYGPFLGRSLLEIGCTAIIARLDPFRILLLGERQKQPDYKIAQRHKISIQWQGDVLSDTGKIKNLWDEKYLKNPTRALIGDYYEILFWHNAIERIFDEIPDDRGGRWLTELRKNEPQKLCGRVRSELSKLYSSLSKGIHHEFVIPPGVSFDQDTVIVLLRDVLFYIAALGLMTTAVSHIKQSLTLIEAVELYEKIQEEFEEIV